MDYTNDNSGKKVILSEDVYNSIQETIDELKTQTRAESIVFCESNGFTVTHVGELTNIDVPALATLAANNFSATTKLANMLGERESFKYLYHEGNETNIYISSVGYEFILLLIFKSDVTLGMVRIYTRKAISTLSDLLENTTVEEKGSGELMDLEFRSLLKDELDKALKL